VVRGVAGQRSSRGLALGCAGHYHASVHSTSTVRKAQPSGNERCVMRRRAAAHKRSLKEDTARRPAHRCISPHGDSEHKGMDLPRSSDPSWAVVHTARLASGHVPGTQWSAQATAVLAHVRPRHTRSARPSGDQRRGSERRGDARVPCKVVRGSTAGSHTRFLTR
jgi:hypothetical protein